MRIARSPTGHRIGESHYRAQLTDDDVRMIRHLNSRHGIGYRRLARKFEVGESTIRDICTYRTRRNA